MKFRLIRLLSALLFLSMIFTSSFVSANPSAADIQKLVEKIKKGESFDDYHTFKPQIYRISVPNVGAYLIDIKAKLCFLHSYGAQITMAVEVPCHKIKLGYPEVAPLITWDNPFR